MDFRLTVTTPVRFVNNIQSDRYNLFVYLCTKGVQQKCKTMFKYAFTMKIIEIIWLCHFFVKIRDFENMNSTPNAWGKF